jgi:hypothetical protein
MKKRAVFFFLSCLIQRLTVSRSVVEQHVDEGGDYDERKLGHTRHHISWRREKIYNASLAPAIDLSINLSVSSAQHRRVLSNMGVGKSPKGQNVLQVKKGGRNIPSFSRAHLETTKNMPASQILHEPSSSSNVQSNAKSISQNYLSVESKQFPWWVSNEESFAKNDIAFGLYTPKSGQSDANIRLDLIAAWWIEGVSGCIFDEQTGVNMNARLLKSLQLDGLAVCEYPMDFLLKPWYESSKHAGRAIIHVLLYRRFPTKKWFIMGDDDTIFSPIALARYLSGPQFASAAEAWYIGGRSESIPARQLNGWDMTPAGAGIILSAGVLREGSIFLQRCLDVAPWADAQATGDWVLNRCLGRLGIPLTATGS